MAVNKHFDQGKSYKVQHLIGAGFHVQRFSLLSSRWEHGSIQAGMGQEELRVLHLHLKTASRILTFRKLGEGLKAHTYVTQPLKQGHTHSNTVTSNSATSWAEHIQTITGI